MTTEQQIYSQVLDTINPRVNPEVYSSVVTWLKSLSMTEQLMFLPHDLGGTYKICYGMEPGDFGYESEAKIAMQCGVKISPYTLMLLPHSGLRGCIIVPDCRSSLQTAWVSIP